MAVRISVVIPALNEQATIGGVVSALTGHSNVDEIIVVDSNSTDQTGRLAAEAGATVIRLDQAGFGRALKAGFAAARNDWIFKIDGDMRNVSPDWLTTHVALLEPGVGLVKAYWDSSEDPMPVTNLVVKPAIRLLMPALAFINMPISGIYLCDKSWLRGHVMADDFTFDLELLVRVFRLGAQIRQAYLPEVLDTLKPINAYRSMAAELLRYLHAQVEIERGTPMMLVMAHPDDAEIWCGGTVAKHLSCGGVVHIWIATGSAERKKEASRIGEMYTNIRVHFLNAEEFGQIASRPSVLRLAQSIGIYRPRSLITHHFADDHPDHRACHDLVKGACLLVDRQALPHSIYLCNTYYQSPSNDRFCPNTFIDISGEADLKYALIAHHQSQDVDHWIRMAKAMDTLNGAKCGVLAAESFQKISLYMSPAASTGL